IGKAARVSRRRRVAADALEMIALKVERARLGQALVAEARVLAHECGAEFRPVALVLPARIGHHPVEIVEEASDEKAQIALARAERGIERQPVFAGDMRDDGLAVADALAIIDDI